MLLKRALPKKTLKIVVKSTEPSVEKGQIKGIFGKKEGRSHPSTRPGYASAEPAESVPE